MLEQSKWYVLQVTVGKEFEVLEALEKRGFNAAVPNIAVPVENRVIRSGGKWKEKPYVIFPGYVFVRMRYNWSQYYIMSAIKSIIKILGGGKDPTALTFDEAEHILSLSDALAVPSVVQFEDDNTYKIISGYLLEHQENIVEIKRRYKRATVRMIVAGEEKEITVSFKEPESSDFKKGELK